MVPVQVTKLIDEEKIAKRVQEIGAQISAKFKGEKMVAICVLKGSYIFYADLIRNLNLDIVCEFFGVSSYENATISSGEVKLTLDLTNPIEGKHVILVEDIVDSGLTMEYLIKTLSARKPKSLTSVALLFKPKALETDVKLDYVGFEIGKEFVVGYGLDYQGYFRNLPYIAQVDIN